MKVVINEEFEAARFDDSARLEWLLWKLPGDALRHCVGEIADTSYADEFRDKIDAAMTKTKHGGNWLNTWNLELT
jgi:hypothetical protein